MGRRPEKKISQRRHTNGLQVHEKMLNIINHQRNAKPQDTTSHLSEWSSLERPQITNVGGDVEERKVQYTVGGTINWGGHCGKHYGVSSSKKL